MMRTNVYTVPIRGQDSFVEFVFLFLCRFWGSDLVIRPGQQGLLPAEPPSLAMFINFSPERKVNKKYAEIASQLPLIPDRVVITRETKNSNVSTDVRGRGPLQNTMGIEVRVNALEICVERQEQGCGPS